MFINSHIFDLKTFVLIKCKCDKSSAVPGACVCGNQADLRFVMTAAMQRLLLFAAGLILLFLFASVFSCPRAQL